MGKLTPMCRNTLPHSPPATSATVYGSGVFAASRVESNQAKPSAIMSAPIRLSGRRRQA